ncbi:hypothetical protein [Kitasatospora aureofaciens]|uniref:hypothetical protein n=1 Tax=Kitasatospora aureofaciens TaxID=1894 RepID=UPI003404C415
MTEPLDLDAIAARCDAAAPGPWTLHDDLDGQGYPGHLWVVQNPTDGPDENRIVISVGDRADGELVAAARQDVPALLARVRELEAETERLRDVLKRTQDLAETDPPTCEFCGHLESAHDSAGERDCNASGARVRSCTCIHFSACYPEPAPSGPQTTA